MSIQSVLIIADTLFGREDFFARLHFFIQETGRNSLLLDSRLATFGTAQDAQPLTSLIGNYDIDFIICDQASRLASLRDAGSRLSESERMRLQGVSGAVIESDQVSLFGSIIDPQASKTFEVPFLSDDSFPSIKFSEPPVEQRYLCLCVQDATPSRITLLSHLQQEGYFVRAFGSGWPASLTASEATPSDLDTVFSFNLNSAYVVLVFDEDATGDIPCENLRSRLVGPLAAGVPLVAHPGKSVSPGFPATACKDVEEIKAALERIRATGARVETSAPELSTWTSRLLQEAERVPAPSLPPTPANAPLTIAGLSGSCAKPAMKLIVAGYFGMDNFGDELILDIMHERLRRLCPKAHIVVLSEKPQAVFMRHGLYAISWSDKLRIQKELEQSLGVIVCAGLLFDTGIYGTMGIPSLTCDSDAPHLPGLASLCLQANLSNTPVVFFGAGAGPLANPDSKKLVNLMGTLGARFICRDEDSERLVLAAGVSPEQASTSVDVAFSLKQPDLAMAEAWRRKQGLAPEADVVCVALREWQGMSADFDKSVARALDAPAAHYPRLCFVFVSFDPQDELLHSRIRGALHQETVARSYGVVHDTSETLSLISSAYCVFASRLHCSIIANVFGVPSIGIDYLPKVGSFYQLTRQSDLVLNIDVNEENILNAFELLFSSYDERKYAIGELVAEARKRYLEAEATLASILDHTVVTPHEGTALFYRTRSEKEDIRQTKNALHAALSEAESLLAQKQHELESIQNLRCFKLAQALSRLRRPSAGKEGR